MNTRLCAALGALLTAALLTTAAACKLPANTGLPDITVPTSGHTTSHTTTHKTTTTGRGSDAGSNAAGGHGTTGGASGGSGDAGAATAGVAKQFTLYQEPDDGYGAVDAAITAARHTVTMTMYELRDDTVISDLKAAADRGATVQVLLDKAFNGGRVNAAAYSTLAADKHVQVKWEPGGTIVHQKTMVIDGATAWISTGNLDSHYYPTAWDDWIADTNPTQVKAVAATFAADWAAAPGKLGQAAAAPGLVWSPGAEQQMAAFIASAKHSVDFTSEELADPVIYQVLAADAKRHITCRIVMTDSTSWITAFDAVTAAGCTVHVYPDTAKALYVHIKQIQVDGDSELIGSTNASATSLKRNRELSLQLGADNAGPLLAALTITFDKNYAAAPAWKR